MIKNIIEQQKILFKANITKNVDFRIHSLQKLKSSIRIHEKDIADALYSDLHKAPSESYMSEIGVVLSELTHTIKHIRSWSKNKTVPTPLAQFYSHSYISPEPYGCVLVMSPWNYPFQLTMVPLIGAIAAGNTVVVKPSAYASATSQIIAEIINECFDEEYVAVIQGGRKENTELLDQRFDYIFFTGGVTIGKLVMEKASRYLTPITLELGGKSPCIVDETANLKLAAKRIAFGKFLNAGQTCVAPDYVLVHESVKQEFILYIMDALRMFFGEHPLACENYPKIVNEKHFMRLQGLMEEEHKAVGGNVNDHMQIEPTILDEVTFHSPVMQEEIFGPILPVISYTDITEVIEYVNNHEKPLALYLFTTNEINEDLILNCCSFGGGCINDTIIHLISNYLPFGGVGMSGMGSYHGKKTFDTFTHYRSIVKKVNWIDLPFRYHPYTKTKDRIIRLFLK